MRRQIWNSPFNDCHITMEAIDPQGVASFDPRGLIGMIYVGDH